jgi:acyl-coenzyme A synthetase/AMP-(fatty) acid ligase
MNTELFDTLKERGHAGLVLFSSGSTGEPKMVLHDWNNLCMAALRKKRNAEYKGMVVLSMLGLDHIGGINTMLFCLANQCELVFPASRSPHDVLHAIEHSKVNILPTTPSFLRMMLMRGIINDFDISSLKLITYGTEPMDSDLLNNLVCAFPTVKFKQTYGLTEVGILSTRDKDKNSLLMKVGGHGYKTRIVDGMLEIKSETSMLGYLNAPCPFTADGYFRTYDRVVSDGEFIQILGRDSEFINVGGDKVNPIDVERAVCTIPGVIDCAAYGVPNPILGQVVGVTILHKTSPTLNNMKRMIRQFLKTDFPRHALPVVVKMTDQPLTNSRLKKMRNDNISQD